MKLTFFFAVQGEFRKLFLASNPDRNHVPFSFLNSGYSGGKSNRRLPFPSLSLQDSTRLFFYHITYFWFSQVLAFSLTASCTVVTFCSASGCMSTCFLMKTHSSFLTQNALKGLACSQSLTSHLQ